MCQINIAVYGIMSVRFACTGLILSIRFDRLPAAQKINEAFGDKDLKIKENEAGLPLFINRRAGGKPASFYKNTSSNALLEIMIVTSPPLHKCFLLSKLRNTHIFWKNQFGK